MTDEKLSLNGIENKSEFMGFPRTSTAGLSANLDTLKVNSSVSFNRGGQTIQLLTTETCNLQSHGKELCIAQISGSPQGKRKIVMVYDKLEAR